MSVVISSDLKHHISRHTSGNSKQLPNPRKTHQLHKVPPSLRLSNSRDGWGRDSATCPAARTLWSALGILASVNQHAGCDLLGMQLPLSHLCDKELTRTLLSCPNELTGSQVRLKWNHFFGLLFMPHIYGDETRKFYWKVAQTINPTQLHSKCKNLYSLLGLTYTNRPRLNWLQLMNKRTLL